MISTVVAPDQVIQQLNWRYATKKFDPNKKIPTEVWKTLEQSLVLAPSSFGLQPWKFFVVTNPELRQQLVEYSWGQTQVVEASHLVVLAIKKDITAADVDHYIERMTEVRQVPVDSLQGFSNVVKNFLKNPPVKLDEWAARQVYIALGQLMTAAAMLEIDTCPMEGFNPAKYNELLGLTEQGYSAVVVCPLGYRAADDKYAVMPKVRFPTEEVVQYI
ncbi:NAD(P)H-dependent oxidoreductase [Aerosakkonemataceae cyanobacterium BLCC-F50]|uniref:NAD(P)H-dependent oxidoreductase n=1 Tax=Floridaenema flaviceps BLCC-F50 TaxID=3153642 RepID=A0ABV4XNY1_9CYAN